MMMVSNDVQFRQRSIPIQFWFRAKDVQFNSDSNSITPENPWNPIPIPIPIPESELHTTGGLLILSDRIAPMTQGLQAWWRLASQTPVVA